MRTAKIGQSFGRLKPFEREVSKSQIDTLVCLGKRDVDWTFSAIFCDQFAQRRDQFRQLRHKYWAVGKIYNPMRTLLAVTQHRPILRAQCVQCRPSTTARG